MHIRRYNPSNTPSDAAAIRAICAATAQPGTPEEVREQLHWQYATPYLALCGTWCWVVVASAAEVAERGGDEGAEDTTTTPDITVTPLSPARAPTPDLAPPTAEPGEKVIGYLVSACNTTEFASAWPQYVRRLPAHVVPPPPPPTFLAYACPAHFHVNMRPGWTGRGLGTQLVQRFVRALRAQGVKGAHCGVALGNGRAAAFYRKCGFCEIFKDAENRQKKESWRRWGDEWVEGARWFVRLEE
ncbi:hypothetical protein EDC01DRAFT_775216 [Geopyxis carbonaria]|nr:hypothetical protein EDC01DRAFT_775216 [Geopyxis carbonaria]